MRKRGPPGKAHRRETSQPDPARRARPHASPARFFNGFGAAERRAIRLETRAIE